MISRQHANCADKQWSICCWPQTQLSVWGGVSLCPTIFLRAKNGQKVTANDVPKLKYHLRHVRPLCDVMLMIICMTSSSCLFQKYPLDWPWGRDQVPVISLVKMLDFVAWQPHSPPADGHILTACPDVHWEPAHSSYTFPADKLFQCEQLQNVFWCGRVRKKSVLHKDRCLIHISMQVGPGEQGVKLACWWAPNFTN